MSLPYFPMFPTDFDADTGHLTFAEDGAYNRLLRLSWKCPGAKMPDDMDWIHRRARAVTAEEKALVVAIIAEFFTRSGGKVFSKRLVEEWAKSSLAHAKRVSAGSAGGRAKALNSKDNGPSNAKAMLKQPEPEPDKKKERGKPLSSVPDGFADFWDAVPIKVAKQDAMRAYAKALKTTDPATILSAIRRYAQSRIGEPERYTAHPASWLNAGRWDDEPSKLIPITGGNHAKSTQGSDRLTAFIAGARGTS